MVRERFDSRTGHLYENGPSTGFDDRSVGQLLKSLATDGTTLVRQEIRLAKIEFRDMGADVAGALPKLGAGLGLALAGLLAMTASLVIALGDALDNYALGALIVGLGLLIV